MSGCEGCDRRRQWLREHPAAVAAGVLALGLIILLMKAQAPKEEKEAG
jgi:hypothetical protein